MDRPVIIFIAVVTVVSLIIAVLLFVLFLQRRRQRALLMLAIAQEEAERRRRKRKKAGLRRWEIDFACPEALVSEISPSASAVALFSVDQHPSQYADGIRVLRAAGLVAFDAAFPDSMPNELADAPALSVDDLDLPKVPMLAEEKGKEPESVARSGAKSTPASEQGEDVPLQVLRLPESMGTCVVCLDEITLGSRVRSLPCRHVYHSQCIRVWLRRKNACPCCCLKVIKRRKKRSRAVEAVIEDDSVGLDPSGLERSEVDVIRSEEEQPSSQQPSAPRSPSPRPPRVATLVYGDGLLPNASERPADRSEDIALDMTEPRSRSLGHGDRPRLSGGAQPAARGRMGSFLDSEDINSEAPNSETSSHLDEPTAAELLYQVRRALRGESSMLSLNTSIDDASEIGLSEQLTLPDIKLDGDPHSFRRELESMNFDDLEAGASSGRLGSEKNDS